jgi:hypothetical protein
MVQNISNLCRLEDIFKRNNYPFGKEFKFQMDCEIKKLGNKSNLNLV